MDVIGRKQAKIRRSKKSAADFKVVYISSPMKVKTSASKFRSLVQKLTGQDSDAERFMELIAAAAAADRNHLQPSSSAAFLDHQLLCDADDDQIDRDNHHRLVSGNIESSYQSSIAPPDDLILQNFDANFADMFHGFLHDSSTQTQMPGLALL
ncbi:uncharacterized protein LOC111010149 [Momordica charantia]|uniref:Uncharacterized protein LOC111010149 n=1 Tax=Momordica charantia TaxID=3673 RepID=A0A6J1CBX0_MOMCH|nr:uncharacterized protein LOC111010149 [Momordica charantia]